MHSGKTTKAPRGKHLGQPRQNQALSQAIQFNRAQRGVSVFLWDLSVLAHSCQVSLGTCQAQCVAPVSQVADSHTRPRDVLRLAEESQGWTQNFSFIVLTLVSERSGSRFEVFLCAQERQKEPRFSLSRLTPAAGALRKVAATASLGIRSGKLTSLWGRPSPRHRGCPWASQFCSGRRKMETARSPFSEPSTKGIHSPAMTGPGGRGRNQGVDKQGSKKQRGLCEHRGGEGR